MSRDTSFYYAFLVLPPRKRSAIVAVWDFCRAVDDAVDESESPRRAALDVEAWRAELGAVFDAGPPRTWQGRALQPFVREYGLPREAFDEVIAGVAMDLGTSRYATFDDLSAYCRRVASAVGLICVEIFGYSDPRARDYAVRLGMALQLTNIVRDVSADAARGRVYLPEEDMARFGVTADDLRRGDVTPAVRGLLRYQCDRARSYYREAAAALPPGDAYHLLAAEIMGAVYFEILRRIEGADYDVFRRRIRVPRPMRAVIALRVWARTLLRLPRPVPRAVR